MRFRLLLLLAVLLSPAGSLAQNYPDIRWKTIETPHAYIHYYDDVEWTARKVAVIFEEAYPKVTGLHHHEPPRRTHIVIRDDEDRSNGFAVANLGWITIWTSPSSLPLRGRHDWIRGVITHEFSHIVSLQAASAAGGLVEGLRFGWVANNSVDYNNSIGASLFVPSNPYARWWAEGTAQLDGETLGADVWDTHREMLLRSATLENNLLDFGQMRNIAVREHLGGEMVYNQGFAFLRWLKETRGLDANLRIAAESQGHFHLDFDSNLEKAFGKSARDLDAEWKRHLNGMYAAQVAEIRKNPLEGDRIPLVSAESLAKADPEDRPYKDGAYNFSGRFSPDGRWFSWIQGRDLKLRYLAAPFDLSNLNPGEAEAKSLPAQLSLAFEGSFYSWSPDATRIVLSRRKSNLVGGYPYFDLYMIDLSDLVALRADYDTAWETAGSDGVRKEATKRYSRRKKGITIEPKRLTHGLRATYVAWSPDGQEIAYTQSRDGGRNLRLIDPDGSNARDLVAIGGDAEATEPAWSPDGKWIAFTLFNHGQADIWIVDRDGSTPKPLTLDAADDRDPVFTPDGASVLFSSDRSDIFQIYALRADAPPGTDPIQLTRVETGAFEPAPSKDGRTLLYNRFSSFGFKPYRLAYSLPETPSPTPAENTQATDSVQAQMTPDTFPQVKGKGYFPWPRPVRFFPSAVFENDQFKAGVAVQVSDYLEKHNLTALALFGRDQDYLVTYENRMFYPTINVGYQSYVRTNLLQFINDGDGIADEPDGILRDNIQFIDAGLSQEFRVDGAFPGTHKLGLWYHRRFVDRRVGFPLFIGNDILTSFRLLTNDQAELSWSFAKRASAAGARDFDINPRNHSRASLSYILDHTQLAAADSTIPGPNQAYFYHLGLLSLEHYIALPWPAPWWEQHTLWFKFNGGMISRRVNINDDFFLGGRLNFRAFGQISPNTLFYGYDPFSIYGETMLLLSTGYTFPIIRHADAKKGIFFFDSLYGGYFWEAGNAWTYGHAKNLYQNPTRDPTLGTGTRILVDAGAELKMKAFLFTESNPWNSVLRVAYGFQDNAKNGFSDTDWPVHVYLGVGTDF